MENNVLKLKRRKCWLWFPIRFTKYEVVEKNGDYELVITTGLLAKHINRIKLYRINDITFDRTLGNFFCGVANIILSTSDQSSKYSGCTISKIRHAKDFMQKLEDLVQSERTRVNVTYSETNVIK